MTQPTPMKAFTNSSEAAQLGLNLTLRQSVEELSQSGLSRRLQEVFGIRSTWVRTTNEREKALAKTGQDANALTPPAAQGKPNYPYATLRIESLGLDRERFNSRALQRFGVPVAINNTGNAALYAKIAPAIIRVQMELVTDNFDWFSAFTSQWLHCRVGGWLHFEVALGQATFTVTVNSEDLIPVPPIEGEEGAIKEIVLQTSLEMRTFSSGRTLMEQQIINKLDVTFADDTLASVQPDANGLPITVHAELSESTRLWSFVTPENEVEGLQVERVKSSPNNY